MLVEKKDTVGEDVPIFITCIGVMHTTIKCFVERLAHPLKQPIVSRVLWLKMVMHHCSGIVHVCQVAPPLQCPISIVNLTKGVFSAMCCNRKRLCPCFQTISSTRLIIVSNTNLLCQKMFDAWQRPHFQSEELSFQVNHVGVDVFKKLNTKY